MLAQPGTTFFTIGDNCWHYCRLDFYVAQIKDIEDRPIVSGTPLIDHPQDPAICAERKSHNICQAISYSKTFTTQRVPNANSLI
jgi:hypothetical protein